MRTALPAIGARDWSRTAGGHPIGGIQIGEGIEERERLQLGDIDDDESEEEQDEELTETLRHPERAAEEATTEQRLRRQRRLQHHNHIYHATTMQIVATPHVPRQGNENRVNDAQHGEKCVSLVCFNRPSPTIISTRLSK